ncbi:MAG: trypsin-like peptidase domain-containing protein [Chthoniobacterales bacterium]
MKSILRFLIFLLIVVLCVITLFFWKRANIFESQLSLEKKSPVPETQHAYSSGSSSLAAQDAEFTQIVNTALPSIVSIQALRGKADPNPLERLLRNRRSEAPEGDIGSGVIVRKDGYIVTNLHVVQGGDSIEVILHDGTRYPATLAGSYAPADLAVLKIDADHLPPLSIGNSDDVHVGQMVFAVGNPYGLQESVSRGIISAKGRRSSNESSRNEFFQTDATLNRGNSGGPLINIRGELIGINDFIFSQSGGSQGIGFAIPSNTVRKVFTDIVTKGRVVQPYLGIERGYTLTPQISAQLRLQDTNGVLVDMVQRGSPVEIAGLLPGDVIRKFNNKIIPDITELRNRIVETTPGQTIPLEVLRGGKATVLNVKIKEEPNEANLFYLPVHPPGQRTAIDGIIIQEIPQAMRQRLMPGKNAAGVIVGGFQSAAPASRVLAPGDIILQVGDQPIASLEGFRELAKILPPNTPQQLFVQRDNLQGWVQIDPR